MKYEVDLKAQFVQEKFNVIRNVIICVFTTRKKKYFSVVQTMLYNNRNRSISSIVTTHAYQVAFNTVVMYHW
jgi:hypothetical protein